MSSGVSAGSAAFWIWPFAWVWVWGVGTGKHIVEEVEGERVNMGDDVILGVWVSGGVDVVAEVVLGFGACEHIVEVVGG